MAYTGIGDITTYQGYWGLRAYSSAQCTGSQKAINVRRASDNTTMDINILTTGFLDVATAAAFGAATTLWVTTIYDQTGNSFDMIQTGTTALQPQLVLTGGPNTNIPMMVFALSEMVMGNTENYSIPFVMGAYAIRTGNFSSLGFILYEANQNVELRFAASPNTIEIYAGSATDVTAADDVWHSIQVLYDDTSSNMFIDGVSNLVSPGNHHIGGALRLGAQDSTPDTPLTGAIFEAYLTDNTLTTTVMGNVYANQAAYVAANNGGTGGASQMFLGM